MTTSADSIDVQPVVMAGGSGTRLWPLSRAGYPKQFLVLTQSKLTLYQEALERVRALEAADIRVAPPLTVANEDHRFLVLEQMRERGLERGSVMLEPAGRNTAPAVTLAALQAQSEGRDPVLVVKAADHTVTDMPACTRALQDAVRQAALGSIVVLGITPLAPETGFGYIKSRAAASGPAAVERFVEKPNAETASRYLAEGGYAWNSGIFVLKASVWLKALQSFRPDILESTKKSFDARQQDQSFIRPDKAAFEAIKGESVDYAVMEKSPGSAFDVRMVPLNAGWSDLGAWDAVWQVAQKDEGGNANVGDAFIQGSRNSMVHATSRLVGLVGVDNVVVVETPDAVLVVHRDRSQDVKGMVDALKAKQRSERHIHRKVHRPWGSYDSIDQGARFQVKRIVVKPGASLSLQMHHHRAEHWIVVSGTAEVTNGDKVIMLSENQSTYIPIGQTHRLRNPGKLELELIEVQSGSYLGEDDIVRFEDTYGRTT
jgi:mannose-1-phosphate guanylyltransferase / mannose-6-phosphate isomerase